MAFFPEIDKIHYEARHGSLLTPAPLVTYPLGVTF